MRQLYQFKEEDALLFSQKYARCEVRRKGNELTFQYCPICHGGSGGKRDKDTFSINMETGACNCLRSSCGYRGNMITLARDFGFSLGREIDEYYAPRREYKKFPTPKKPLEPKEPAIKYLESRGISAEIAKKYEITTYKNRDNILVIPHFDAENKLCFIKYRKTDYDKTKDKAKEWPEANCKPVLFGMKQCNLENKTLTVVEGQVDCLSVAEAGIENVVSVPMGVNNFTWVPYCFDWMSNFEEIIVFGDNEKGKITLLDDIKRRFPQVIKHVRQEDYKGCKDANDILRKYGKQALADAVNNAVIVPVKRVVAGQDVGMADYSKMQKLRTNIRRLDILLSGGLPFGTVCLITGKRGDGKSCLASNLITSAIDQGHVTFVYSGEMRKEHVKRSISLQAAGRKHIMENRTNFGIQKVITNHNMELINRWVTDKLFIYDCDEIDDEQEDLLDTIETSIKQNGLNVILIDNLMTAMYLDETKAADKYDKQGRFVRSLTKLAVTYNVLVLLVAHRRKTSIVIDANDEVSGSADITNLAGVVMSYDRGTKKDFEDGTMDDTQRKLILSKNRFYGKLDFDGIILSYDEKSTRVYDETEENYGSLTMEYSWGGSPSNGWLNDQDDNPFE